MKIKKILNMFILFALSLVLCGCATLSYSGEDYVADNQQTVKTNEEFVFNTYKKSLEGANVKIGISRTPVPEILAIYIQIENLSYETPYTFRVEDLEVSDTDERLPFITSNNYLSIYQTQEATAMNSMSMMGASITNLTGMSSNYNEYNQTMAQNISESTNKSTFAKMEQIGNQILAHTTKVSSNISPRRSKYFYFFVEDTDSFPLTVKYKNLSYQFKL